MAELLWPICSPKNRKEFESDSDTDFAYEVPGLARFRCNYFMDRTGMGAVFRQIPTKIPTMEQLGLPKEIVDLCWLSKGFVVVTGPTGSGKSTTLAALIDLINENRTDHIITIEDPIEFVHPNKKCLLNQREVGTHTQGFKRALRAALREDPDIVLVGEMRDLETIGIAIETAETGHLVFGTLHTTTAPSTVDRIIDQFPADRQTQIRVMLSESLKGVIAQTLCSKIGGGRVAAYEMLIVNTAGLEPDPRGQDLPDPLPDADPARSSGCARSTTRSSSSSRPSWSSRRRPTSRPWTRAALLALYERGRHPLRPEPDVGGTQRGSGAARSPATSRLTAGQPPRQAPWCAHCRARAGVSPEGPEELQRAGAPRSPRTASVSRLPSRNSGRARKAGSRGRPSRRGAPRAWSSPRGSAPPRQRLVGAGSPARSRRRPRPAARGGAPAARRGARGTPGRRCSRVQVARRQRVAEDQEVLGARPRAGAPPPTGGTRQSRVQTLLSIGERRAM